MKSSPTTESSGSSISGTEVAWHTRYGVKKATSPTKNTSKLARATGAESSRKETKWQKYLESASDPSTDDGVVRARFFDVLKDETLKLGAEKRPYRNVGGYSEYDVKGLMAKVYQDLQDVAEAQIFTSASPEPQTVRACLGNPDLFLRIVSNGVTIALKSALAYLDSPENPQASEVWDFDEKMARSLSNQDPSYERYENLTTRPTWKFLAKLAHSAAFREAVCTLDDLTWQRVSASIDENAVSLMVFVECNGLQWWDELIRLNSLFPSSPPHDLTKYQTGKPPKATPHKWVVTEKHEDIRRPKFEGRNQVNISENIYKRREFKQSPRPPTWPADRPYPEDPLKVHNTSIKPCLTCKSHHPCTCSFLDDPHVWSPLVELLDYGHKGVGVRALQRIPRKAILAEYLGEIYPSNYDKDPIYALDFSLPGSPNYDVIASVSSKRYGNWTRFINHSCDASTRFTTLTVGGRHKSVVQAERDIEMFEEVTIDYGDGYWRHRVCECGVEWCRSRMKKEAVRKEGPEGWDLPDGDWEIFEASFEVGVAGQME